MGGLVQRQKIFVSLIRFIMRKLVIYDRHVVELYKFVEIDGEKLKYFTLARSIKMLLLICKRSEYNW